MEKQDINPVDQQIPTPKIRKIGKSKTKKKTETRTSNRRYPARNCKEIECNEEFIPTDSRHLYCCEQHRIDHNNDKRKAIDKIENDFTQQVKKNRAILIKIFGSKEYKNRGYIHISVLDYEGYDFSVYHNTLIESSTKRELKICYDYAIILMNSENQYYKIINKQIHEF